jgi:hypothetical protein
MASRSVSQALSMEYDRDCGDTPCTVYGIASSPFLTALSSISELGRQLPPSDGSAPRSAQARKP